MKRWIHSMGVLSLFAIFWLVADGSAALGRMSPQHESDLQNPFEFSPAKIDFGQQLVGTQSAARVALLKNKSIKARNFLVFKVEGQYPGDFKVSNDCGSFLPPGTSCAVHVAFSPQDFGGRGASVRVTDSFGSIQTLSVTGIGSQPPPPPPPSPSDATGPPSSD